MQVERHMTKLVNFSSKLLSWKTLEGKFKIALQ